LSNPLDLTRRYSPARQLGLFRLNYASRILNPLINYSNSENFINYGMDAFIYLDSSLIVLFLVRLVEPLNNKH